MPSPTHRVPFRARMEIHYYILVCCVLSVGVDANNPFKNKAVGSGRQRYIIVTPEQIHASVGEWPLHVWLEKTDEARGFRGTGLLSLTESYMQFPSLGSFGSKTSRTFSSDRGQNYL